MVTKDSRPRVTRNTARVADRKAKGVYWRRRADGSKSWSFLVERGKWSEAFGSREACIEAQSENKLRKARGLPAPDLRVTIADLVAEVRRTKAQRVRRSTLQNDERGLALIEREIGHLRPAQLIGTAHLDRLVSRMLEGTLTGTKLAPATIRRYLAPLGAISKLALRRGLIQVSLLDLVEWPKATDHKQRFVWSRQSIIGLIESSKRLGQRPEARADYSSLLQVLALTGLRVGEALALRVQDVDLLSGKLFVRATLGRDGTLGAPKTVAGKRVVPVGDELISVLARVIPVDAEPEGFVFHAKGHPARPLNYWNVRDRGFEPARDAAGLPRNVTLHSLRSAAVSFLHEQGLTLVEIASIVGHSNSVITARAYADVFEDEFLAQRVRAAQDSLREVRFASPRRSGD